MEKQTARAIYASESGGNAEDIEMTLKVPTPNRTPNPSSCETHSLFHCHPPLRSRSIISRQQSGGLPIAMLDDTMDAFDSHTKPAQQTLNATKHTLPKSLVAATIFFNDNH